MEKAGFSELTKVQKQQKARMSCLVRFDSQSRAVSKQIGRKAVCIFPAHFHGPILLCMLRVLFILWQGMC
jgi:hypothetical protein